MADPFRRYNLAAIALTVLASLQMGAYLIGHTPLRGLAALTTAAPFPKVFTDVDGLETFASEFSLEWIAGDGQRVVRPITPELYQRLEGPYNRRNVYGAALSYAPRLPEPLWQTLFCRSLAPGGALRASLEVPDDARAVTVVIRTRTQGRNDVWRLSPPCLQ